MNVVSRKLKSKLKRKKKDGTFDEYNTPPCYGAGCSKESLPPYSREFRFPTPEACPRGVGMNQICKMLCSPIEESTTICESGKTLARVGSCCGVQCVPKHCLGGKW